MVKVVWNINNKNIHFFVVFGRPRGVCAPHHHHFVKPPRCCAPQESHRTEPQLRVKLGSRLRFVVTAPPEPKLQFTVCSQPQPGYGGPLDQNHTRTHLEIKENKRKEVQNWGKETFLSRDETSRQSWWFPLKARDKHVDDDRCLTQTIKAPRSKVWSSALEEVIQKSWRGFICAFDVLLKSPRWGPKLLLERRMMNYFSTWTL